MAVVFRPAALSEDVDVSVAAAPFVLVVVVVTMISPDAASLELPFVYLAVRFVALVEFSDDDEGLNVRIPAVVDVVLACCCCCWRSGFSYVVCLFI